MGMRVLVGVSQLQCLSGCLSDALSWLVSLRRSVSTGALLWKAKGGSTVTDREHWIDDAVDHNAAVFQPYSTLHRCILCFHSTGLGPNSPRPRANVRFGFGYRGRRLKADIGVDVELGDRSNPHIEESQSNPMRFNSVKFSVTVQWYFEVLLGTLRYI